MWRHLGAILSTVCGLVSGVNWRYTREGSGEREEEILNNCIRERCNFVSKKGGWIQRGWNGSGNVQERKISHSQLSCFNYRAIRQCLCVGKMRYGSICQVRFSVRTFVQFSLRPYLHQFLEIKSWRELQACRIKLHRLTAVHMLLCRVSLSRSHSFFPLLSVEFSFTNADNRSF